MSERDDDERNSAAKLPGREYYHNSLSSAAASCVISSSALNYRHGRLLRGAESTRGRRRGRERGAGFLQSGIKSAISRAALRRENPESRRLDAVTRRRYPSPNEACGVYYREAQVTRNKIQFPVDFSPFTCRLLHCKFARPPRWRGCFSLPFFSDLPSREPLNVSPKPHRLLHTNTPFSRVASQVSQQLEAADSVREPARLRLVQVPSRHTPAAREKDQRRRYG